ncbi:MAG TPA: acyltransferase [Steroidobacteraceae bacterium]
MARELRINNFDLLRILAALQVVMGHSAWHLGIAQPNWWWLVDAFPGVPVFFMISGFLISASYERSLSVGSYARNRMLRIFPGLWCCLLVTVIVASLFGFRFLRWQAVAWLICQVAGLIYTPHFLKDFGFGSYNGSLWTIPIELQFYAALPVLYWLTRKARNRTALYWLAWGLFFGIALGTSMIFAPLREQAVEPLSHKLLRYSFLPHFYLFLTGVLFQRLQVYRYKWIAGKGLYWLAGYLILVRIIPYSAPVYVAFMLVLAIVAVSIAYSAPTLAHKILRGNDISYGVYIYHGLLINVFVEFGLVGRGVYVALITCLACVAAYVSWIGVERPCLRKKKQTLAPNYAAVAP